MNSRTRNCLLENDFKIAFDTAMDSLRGMVVIRYFTILFDDDIFCPWKFCVVLQTQTLLDTQSH